MATPTSEIKIYLLEDRIFRECRAFVRVYRILTQDFRSKKLSFSTLTARLRPILPLQGRDKIAHKAEPNREIKGNSLAYAPGSSLILYICML